MKMQDITFENDLLKIKEFLSKHCSESLSAMQKSQELLLHASTDLFNQIGKKIMDGNVVFSKTTKRKPIYPYPNAEKLFIKAGFKALRSNSIFCYPGLEKTKDYGDNIYAIFPLNGFNFTWSSCNTDYFRDSDNSYVNMPVAEFLQRNGFHNTNFEKALKFKDHEIFINGKFVAININYFGLKKLKSMLLSK